MAEKSAADLLFFRAGYLELTPSLDAYFQNTYNINLEKVVLNLLSTRMFAVDDGYLRPVSNLTFMITNDDETGFVAMDQARMDGWCEKNGLSPNYMKLVLL